LNCHQPGLLGWLRMVTLTVARTDPVGVEVAWSGLSVSCRSTYEPRPI